MWLLLLSLCLLDHRVSPLPWERLQPTLQQQLAQSTLTPPPAVGHSSSSSSSSSSSESSESSHSSESHQLLRARQNMENMAVEQTDSQETPTNSSSLWLSELVLLGERVGEWDAERDTGDDSAESRESRRRAFMLTFHLLSPPRPEGRGLDLTAEGGAVEGKVGVAVEEEGVFTGGDDSTAHELTFDSSVGHAHHRDYHGNEAGLELGL